LFKDFVHGNQKQKFIKTSLRVISVNSVLSMQAVSMGSELDPQTGMFYVEKAGNISGIKINPDGHHVCSMELIL